jgi:hypothetical protein
MAGPPPGFNDFLSQKYAIQQQEANARSNLLNTQAAWLGPQARAGIGLQRAEAYKTGQEGEQVAPTAAAQRGLWGAEAGEAGQRGRYFGALGTGEDIMNQPASDLENANQHRAMTQNWGVGQPGGNIWSAGAGNGRLGPGVTSLNGGVGGSGIWDSFMHGLGIGYARGTARVAPAKSAAKSSARSAAPVAGPAAGQSLNQLMAMLQQGNQGTPGGVANAPMPAAGPGLGMAFGGVVPGAGSGKTDTVPAVLAPGEAVLNQAAADHLGRNTIEVLNALGRHQMGMAGTEPASPQKPGRGMPAAKKPVAKPTVKK